MQAPQDKLRKLITLLITWTLLLGFFLAYDTYFVASQKEFLVGRDFRDLAGLSRKIADEFDRARLSVESGVKLANPADRALAGELKCGIRSGAECRREYIGLYLNEVLVREESPVAIPECWGRHAVTDRGGMDHTIPLETIQETGRLKLDVSCFTGQDPTDPGKPDRATKKPVFVLNMSPWMGTALEQVTDSFDRIVIADTSGHVLFEQGSSSLQISDLTSLIASSTEVGARKTGGGFLGKGTQESAATDAGTNPGRKLANLSERSAASRIVVGGRNYLLFSQPLRIMLGNYPAGGSPLSLVVCGLRQEASLDAESRSLPYGFLIWVGLIGIVLLSVSWPLFKLRYMGNTERFSPRDGWYLILALFLMSTGTMLMLLNASYMSQARDAADGQMKRLAGQIRSNFLSEIGSAFKQLRALRSDASFDQAGMDPSAPTLHGSYLTEAPGKQLTYPYFQIAFWADCHGRQVLKFDVRPAPTPPTDVSRFDFFKDAMNQIMQAGTRADTAESRCPEVPPGLDPIADSIDHLYLQPLMSPNTDEFSPTLSAPFSLGLEKTKKIWIQALIVRPMSVVEPVLPPGYEFAVIDSQCEVLFHSDTFRNLRENFCDESKNKTELRPWLVGGIDAPLNITYAGRTVRAYLTTFPVPHLSGAGGTFLIVFEGRDRELTLNLAVVLVCAILLAGYFALLAATAVLHLLSRRSFNLIYLPSFMWPQPKRALAYIELFCANALTFAFYLVVSRYLYEAPLLALTMEVAFFSIILSVATLACSPRSLHEWGVRTMIGGGSAIVLIALSHVLSRLLSRSLPFTFSLEWTILFVLPILMGGCAILVARETSPVVAADSRTGLLMHEHFTAAYALTAASLIACVAIAPCVGFFKYAYDAISEISLKHDQAVLAESVVARGDGIGSHYADLGAPGFASCRALQYLDRYDKLFFSVTSASPAPGDEQQHCQILSSSPENWATSEPVNEKDCAHKSAPPSNRLNDWIEKAIARVTLTFPSNEIGSEMSRLGVASTESENPWERSWKEKNPRRFVLCGTAGSRLSDLRIMSTYPQWEGLTLGASGYLTLFMTGLVFWLISLTRQIFLTDVLSPPAFERVRWEAVSDIKRNYLVIGRTQSGKTRLIRELSGLDLRDWRDLRAELTRLIKDTNYQSPPCHGKVLILDHFEFNISDSIWNRVRLELLETLLYQSLCKEGELSSQPGPAIVIVSTIDPSYFMSEEASKILSDGKDPAESSRLFDRWVRALSKFTKVSLAHEIRDEFFTKIAETAERGGRHAQFAAWVCSECASTSLLRRLGITILNEFSDPLPESREQLREMVLDRADTYYRVLWSGLTASERLVLYQLALDGWANPRNAPAIQQLERKQLICKAPMYRVMNDSFCRFVQSSEHTREISDWEIHEQESTWHAFRFVLIAVLIGGGVWLLYAQAQLFQLGTGTITAIATLLTAIAGFSARSKRAPEQADAKSAQP